jgi:hypothetical protein
MPKHHVIITGTGRAGTTFLVQLLTELKLDTGFTDPKPHIHESCHAGLEYDLRQPNAPYIVKNPWMIEYLDELLTNQTIVVDHALIPVRDLFAAAESRRVISQQAGNIENPDQVPGGLWLTKKPQEQENVLIHQFYKLFHTLSKFDIPVTLLYYPRLVQDPVYLYEKLKFLLKPPLETVLFEGTLFGKIIQSLKQEPDPYQTFLQAYQKVYQPELVHQFKKG